MRTSTSWRASRDPSCRATITESGRPVSTLARVLILADDLTGAADSAAAFLGRARCVSVFLDPRIRAPADVVALDLDTRSRPERKARAIVRRAFSGRAARSARILYKKIDSTLRGHVSAELAAASQALGRRPLLFTPAFPAQGRIVRDATLVLNGKTQTGDMRSLLTRAGFPTARIDLAAVRGRGLAGALRSALATGARALVCDAASDADLDALARAGLSLRPRPLFVGAAGLARALARSLAAKRAAPLPAVSPRPVATIVGSESPISANQARRLARDPSAILVQMAWRQEPVSSVHYVLTGGETARAVLGARGIREIRLLGEVEPGVPFGIARDGTLVCTKAGAFGGPDTLVRCVARLKREMKRT